MLYFVFSLNKPSLLLSSIALTSLLSDLSSNCYRSVRYHPVFPFSFFRAASNPETSTHPRQLPFRQQVEMSHEWSSSGKVMRQKVWERVTPGNITRTIHRAVSSPIIIHSCIKSDVEIYRQHIDGEENQMTCFIFSPLLIINKTNLISDID